MGQLHHAVARPAARRWPAAVTAALALTAVVVASCGPSTPSTPVGSGPAGSATGSASPAGSGDPSVPASGTASPAAAPVAPGEGRLVWLTDAAGTLGVWTTDLAGGDVRRYAGDMDDDVVALRDPTVVGDSVLVIRDDPTGALWRLSPGGAPSQVLLDQVAGTQRLAGDAVLAWRDRGRTRELWRVPLQGRAERIGELVLPRDEASLGGFGVALSPDGQTIAAGWVGGPVLVMGPAPSARADIGRPLAVDDAGRILATVGRAGEAYRLDGDAMQPLAPEDADPLAAPGSAIVAWGATDPAGELTGIEVHDLATDTTRTYPATGPATNVVEVTADHVLLEATPFDPLRRTLTWLRLRDGAIGTFEATAPPATAP